MNNRDRINKRRHRMRPSRCLFDRHKMFARRPRKQLDSKRRQNSLRANVLRWVSVHSNICLQYVYTEIHIIDEGIKE